MIRFYVLKVNIFETRQINKKKEERKRLEMLFRKHLFSYSPESKKCGFEGILFKQNTNNPRKVFDGTIGKGSPGWGAPPGSAIV